MAKKQLSWTLGDSSMTCMWIESMPRVDVTFQFRDIVDYVEPVGIAFPLFRHGLKQMLADCVSGASKRGDSPEMQKTSMLGAWEAIRSGKKQTRANAKPVVTEESVRTVAENLGQDPEVMVTMLKLLGLLK